MHRLQDGMAARGDPLQPHRPVLRRFAPSQEHDAVAPLFGDDLENAFREAFPALLLVRVRLVRLNGEAGIEKEDTAVGPGSEEAAVFGGRLEGGVVIFEGL